MPSKKENTSADSQESKTLTFTGSYQYAHGKRKTAIAKVRLYDKGQGRILVNGKPYTQYLSIPETKEIIESPLKLTDQMKNFDVSVMVKGSGPHAQAEAIRHGISKALQLYNPEFRATLKKAGFLTRDSRIKERKKYGLKRARRGPQFSKR